MNKRLQGILNLIQQSGSLTPEEKKSLADAVKESDKEITITEFKLERTEKVKRTTAILLEETIAELEQKRKSVEAQNRELEIEGALEKVRSRSIAMRQSSELGDLSFELVKQVQALGIATWHCAFNIYDEGQESSTEWGSNANGSYPIYKTPREGIFKRYYEVGQSGATLHVEVIEEDRCADHYAYLCTLPGVGDTLVKLRDSGTPFPKSQIDHVAYFKYGYLLFITFAPAPEAHDIFKRFAKVFEQTYTRFLDLQQAEAQTRESQIQLALERVRARTMAMQKSDELREVVATLYEQLSQLNFDSNACNIIIIDNKTNNQQYWVSGFMQKLYPESYNVPYFEHSYIDVQLQSWKQGEKYTVIEYSGKTKKEFDKQFFSQTEFKNIPQEVQEIIKSFESARLSTAFFTYGALQIIGPSSLSDENAKILQRFASVFDQTYTRFLDLQKAEAQTREAKTESALEKVRSRTMAMQHSSELTEISFLLIKQVLGLGIKTWGCAFNIFDEDQPSSTEWFSNEQGYKSTYKIPREGVFLRYYEAAQRGESLHVEEFRGDACIAHYKYLSTLPGLDDEMKFYAEHGVPLPSTQFDNVTYFKYGYLLFVTYEDVPEAHDTFKRFAKVFEQTYTRFLDLKKAEGQAWESKIEAALEKVRSRSLAMHKSEEVGFVVDELFLRMKDLEIGFDSVNILEFTEDAFQIWAAYQPGKFTVTKIPFTKSDIPYVRSAVEAKNRGKQLFAHQYAFEEKNVFLKYLFEETHFKNLPEERKQFLLQCPCYTVSIAFAKNTAIQLQSYSRDAFSESENTLLKRFVNVFEQAYTRFLDLQRAEAQARESQIEAALERVRSRTMAMQKSQELPDAANLLFHQVQTLGMPAWSAGYCIWDEDKQGITLWMSSEGVIQPPFHAPLSEDPSFIRMREAYQRGETFHVDELGGEACKVHYQYMRKLPVVGEILDSIIKAGHPLPAYQIFHCSYFTQGFLLFITYEAVPEAWGIFKRFAKVFEQTYTRFVDLQKAEAQAREAKIEAVLERVRSRTMAMHKSDELTDVAGLLFEQVSTLDIKTWTAGFNVWSEDNNSYVDYITSPQGGFIEPYTVYTEKAEALTDISNARKSGVEFDVLYVEGEKIKQLYLALTKLDEKAFEIMLQDGVRFPSHQYEHFVFGSRVSLMFITYEPVPEAHDIFKRLGKVFEQTYTRFLDLQKAEAQTREAQIETALEKVRSTSLAMHRSDELEKVVLVLFEKLAELGLSFDGATICLFDKGKRNIQFWIATKFLSTPIKVDLPYDEDFSKNPIVMDLWRAIETGEHVLNKSYTGKAKDDYFRYTAVHNEAQIPESVREFHLHAESWTVTFAAEKNSIVGFDSWSGHITLDADFQILKRFARVFEQCYTRFLDLRKAEAQAREAQVEAALERTRTQSMLMQHSVQLDDTLRVFHEQVLLLGINSAFSFLWLPDEKNDRHIFWAVWAENSPNGQVKKDSTVFKSKAINYPLDRNEPATAQCLVDWKSDQPVHSYDVPPADVENYFAAWRELLDGVEKLKPEFFQGGLYYVEAFMKYGCFGVMAEADMPEEEKKILGRLAIEFERVYTRFLDLQKAEAQARESQIEAALERVRSRTMAMHRSEEIADILGKIFKELTLLDVNLNRVLIWIFNPDEKYISWWSANPEAESNAESYRVDYNEHPVFLTYYEGWQKKLPLLLYTLGGDEKNSWENHLFKNTELSKLPKAVQDGMRSEKQIFTTSAISDFGLMMAGCFEPFSDEVNDIIQRFGRVFQQSYTRYVDVQKAEAQAREATIEASLEKVRGKAMGMHNSNDLVSTASLVFTELRKLGIDSFRNGVGLLTKENRNVKLYSATSSEEGGSFSVVGWAVLDHHPVLSKTYDSWVNNEDYFPAMKGETLKSYYDKIAATFTVPVEQSEGYEQHGYFLPFSEGLFYGWSEKPFTETEIKILNRFRGIVDLTFRRYMELQKSEATAKEAIRQASLDRVRAEIASMRTTTDLDRITPLIWKELGILSIPFVRCGVFIMDELQQQIHTFLSTPEGKAIGAFHLPYDVPGKIGEILAHWTSKQMYVNHWDEADFGEMGEILVQQKAIPTKAIYMSTVPPGGIHLHCLPFMQGMLYVGNTTELREDDIHLIQSVADAFATAYARYEDFNKLESAKDQIEKTLTDLKQTQNQLVQSEKMASLGELTAGIAHEIQNPLNFINNFSEVNKELLAEMGEEIEKGNFEEVKAIVKHIIGNEEKINHHGKRADGIVKGMLQHSRTSSGVKEPTDINVLAEEYLRLAYHGLRAKDKSFNASMKTDFDKTIGTINIIPQDIGRVILNLISNAFYAVTEKKKENGEGHQPTVHVSTRKEGDKVLISVKDNGNGIPKKVLDKIFQPFFTTKPTGQGTGLGLSLSYDIVKAHGGEIRVETKDGEGAEFILELLYI